jgi:hypothetical protein
MSRKHRRDEPDLARQPDRESRGPDVDNWNEGYGHLGGRGWYEGWSDAMHRGEGPYAGRGPRNYRRSDGRIEEDINEGLTQHSMIDATDIEVSVQNGEVTLRGVVDSRAAKRLAEDIADWVSGVKEVHNQIRVRQKGWDQTESHGEQRRVG